MKIKKRYLRYLNKSVSWRRKLRNIEWNIRHILGINRHPLWGPFPLYAKIEIDQRCNLRCLVGDTNILMVDNTWKQLRDIQIGDYVIGVRKPDKKGEHMRYISTRVTKIFPGIEEEIGELLLDNGVELRGTLDHLIMTKHGRWIPMSNLSNNNPPKFVGTPRVYGTQKINSIKTIGKDLVYNIETECGNYVAQGLIVHNCIMCFRESGITNNKFMTLDEFKSIIDKLGPGLCEVWPHGFGEPMIHPQFFEMMQYLRDKGIMWSVATNGTFLTPENNKKLLETEAHIVRISMDAGEKKEYERIRVGAKFHEVIAGIRDLIRQRDAGGYDTKVNLYSVVGVDSFIPNVPQMIQLHDDLGTDAITISDMSYGNEFGVSTTNNSLRMNYSDEELHKMTAEWEKRPDVFFGAFYLPKKRECVYTKLHCYIHANGDFYSCTCTPGHEEPLWNMKDVKDWKHLRDLYSNSDVIQDFRERSMPDKLCHACEVCASWAEDLSDVV
jgi:MoaA/NifB/PqqE/SkfB family radical SAM enzyme